MAAAWLLQPRREELRRRPRLRRPLVIHPRRDRRHRCLQLVRRAREHGALEALDEIVSAEEAREHRDLELVVEKVVAALLQPVQHHAHARALRLELRRRLLRERIDAPPRIRHQGNVGADEGRLTALASLVGSEHRSRERELALQLCRRACVRADHSQDAPLERLPLHRRQALRIALRMRRERPAEIDRDQPGGISGGGGGLTPVALLLEAPRRACAHGQHRHGLAKLLCPVLGNIADDRVEIPWRREQVCLVDDEEDLLAPRADGAEERPLRL